jgi:hypothetical protein
MSMLNRGIQQLCYRQGKMLLNKNMKVEHVFYLFIIML